MNDLRPLIRLHRWRLDEKQRALAELHGQEDRLITAAENLEAEIKAEQRAACADYEISFGYANFAQAAIGRRGRLADELAEIRHQIAVATDELADTFQEVKRYELAQEERVRQENERLRHKENEMLDETAVTGFRRRQAEDAEDAAEMDRKQP